MTDRDDAAAGPGDLLVGRAGQPHLEFVGAVAGIDEMGVAVDQAGRDPAAFAIDGLGALRERCRQLGLRAGIDDPPVARGDRAVLDDAEARRALGQGRQARIAPEPNSRLPRLLLLCQPSCFSVSIG